MATTEESSQSISNDDLTSASPLTGGLLLYGMQAAFASPGADWKLVDRLDANPLVTPRPSRAIWQNKQAASRALYVQLDEYDSAAAASEGLDGWLKRYQLSTMKSGDKIGEVSYYGSREFAPVIYFLRANIVVGVTSYGASSAEVEATAARLDSFLTWYPQSYDKAPLCTDVQKMTAPGVYLIDYEPQQPAATQYFKFFTGGAVPERKSVNLYVMLPKDVSATRLQLFLNNADSGRVQGTPPFEIPPRS
ncbi:hypothetical protein JY651_50995 [Pyxidicoccus parkwayensis]|uniref:DUF3298 domain-containing protein n=1 Tax=Pyxidicoccus parkwayensis TaxID=2813578 RepID=A0ABX7P0U4_9BACT|nr:hypothetical protein [Pyxidicoccus parkwaysis]QSQ23314.1 hypothetical protein JY651_50995 [Pyxidicoccus parkwaysis]